LSYDRVASIRYTNFEILTELSPIGWSWPQDGNRYSGLVRAGLGFWRRYNTFWIGGFATYQLSRISNDNFGAQLIVFNREGPGFHLGALVDTHGRPGFLAAFSIYAVALEVQSQWFEPGNARPVVSFYLKLTIPLFHMTDELTYLRRTE
jgi:hypothetical protein